MSEIKKEEAKQDADLTAIQPAPIEEKKVEDVVVIGDKVIEEEKVTVSKKELETLQNKARDFENSIELKRISKLEKKEPPKNDDEMVAKVQKLEEKLSTFEANSFNSNLSKAYRQFVQANPWANDDAKFDKIKDAFVSVGTESEEELLSKLKSAAQSSFPVEYEKHLEDKIKAKLLSEKNLVPDGGGAGAAEILHKDAKNVKTEEDLRKERLGALLRKNMTWLK